MGLIILRLDTYILDWYDYLAITLTITINGLFFIDLVLHILALSFMGIVKYHREFLVEGVVQIFVLVMSLWIVLFSESQLFKLIKLYSIVPALRIITLAPLFNEISVFKVITNTAARLATPFLMIMFSLYLVFFMFNIFGTFVFQEVITFDDWPTALNDGGNSLYIYLNFNDFFSGFLFVFTILVSNNWNSFTAIYCDLVGNQWPEIYFSLMFIMMIFIMLNLVVSFILEIYDIVQDETGEKLRVTQDVQYLYNACNKSQDALFLVNLVDKVAKDQNLTKEDSDSDKSLKKTKKKRNLKVSP